MSIKGIETGEVHKGGYKTLGVKGRCRPGLSGFFPCTWARGGYGYSYSPLPDARKIPPRREERYTVAGLPASGIGGRREEFERDHPGIVGIRNSLGDKGCGVACSRGDTAHPPLSWRRRYTSPENLCNYAIARQRAKMPLLPRSRLLWLGIMVDRSRQGLLVTRPVFGSYLGATVLRFTSDSYFTGTRCFNSSNQFTKMLIF
jgi:hypothetical protein